MRCQFVKSRVSKDKCQCFKYTLQMLKVISKDMTMKLLKTIQGQWWEIYYIYLMSKEMCIAEKMWEVWDTSSRQCSPYTSQTSSAFGNNTHVFGQSWLPS